MAQPTRLDNKTAIVTGSANGIGAETVRLYNSLGANVLIADLSSSRDAAETLIQSLQDPNRATFIPGNIAIWKEISTLFDQTKRLFGQIDIVIANAGIMESRSFYDFETGDDGLLREDDGVHRVIGVNLKGTMNNWISGSIVLVSSTSGFFGGTPVVSYIASKHGVVGLLRSSQTAARKYGVRVNGVAPFITPTFITEGYSQSYAETGLPLNKPEDVAGAIVKTSVDSGSQGRCFLVDGGKTKEVEEARNAAIASYMGDEIKTAMDGAKKFFDVIGGYPLPRARA